MKYNASNYIGKHIQLLPGDTQKKYGIIEDVDDLGFIVRITNTTDHYKANEVIFISHSKPFIFKEIH